MAGSVEGATERDACAILAKALELGSADAASELGRAYLRGFGVKHSEGTGLRLLKRAPREGAPSGRATSRITISITMSLISR